MSNKRRAFIVAALIQEHRANQHQYADRVDCPLCQAYIAGGDDE